MILIGNNIVNIAAASLATLISLQIATTIGYHQNLIVTLSTILVTILILLFGEIFPKTFANQHTEKISLFIAPIYVFLIKIFHPIILVIQWMMQGLSKKGDKKVSISESDFEAFVDLSRKSGALDQGEDIRIKKLLDLDELTAEEVMTPRVKIKALKDDINLDQAIKIVSEQAYSRIPIYHTRIDDIDRIVTFKELIRYKQQFPWNTLLRDLDLENIIKIPGTQPINTILEKFQKTHKHLGLVIDEFGGVEGVISLEDIIEEVFWEIQDEVDEEILAIRKENGNGTLLCQSHARIDEVLDALELDFSNLEIEEEFESATLGYFITSHLERFPQQGEEIRIPINHHEEDQSLKEEKSDQDQHSALVFKVLGAKKNIIAEVRVAIEKLDYSEKKDPEL